MLLVCCWRTLKEISLFFGDILKNLEIEGESENYLLTSKRVCITKVIFMRKNQKLFLKKVFLIGDYYIENILTTRHVNNF